VWAPIVEGGFAALLVAGTADVKPWPEQDALRIPTTRPATASFFMELLLTYEPTWRRDPAYIPGFE
jgi:hypothetical protein